MRSDVLASDLAKDPVNRWMPTYLEALKTAKQELGYQEGAQVEAVLGLKLNQALIGELSSGKALNQAAQEIKAIFEKSGRKTGVGRRWGSEGRSLSGPWCLEMRSEAPRLQRAGACRASRASLPLSMPPMPEGEHRHTRCPCHAEHGVR